MDVLHIRRKKICRKLSTITIPSKLKWFDIEKSVGIFRSYCESKEYAFLEVEKYNDSELSSLLPKFYAEVCTKSSESSMVSYILNLFISEIFMRYSKTNTIWLISRSS